MSWVRAYSKHAASSIFRIADLQWAELGDAWGLLRLPSMPELKKWDGDRSLGVSLDLANFAYMDKTREKQRLEELSRAAEGRDGEGIDAKDRTKGKRKDRDELAWSQKKEQRIAKDVRREKKKAKREHERVSKLSTEERAKEDELQDMIQAVRKKVVDEKEFEGFSD